MMSQKCTNEQITLNTLLAFSSIDDGTATTLVEVVVDRLGNNEYHGLVSYLVAPVLPFFSQRVY